MSKKCSSNKQCILKKGGGEDKALTGLGALQSCYSMVGNNINNVKTCLHHCYSHTEYVQRNKEHNMWGDQCETIGGYSLGFTEQFVLSYSLPLPDDLQYQVMGGKKP